MSALLFSAGLETDGLETHASDSLRQLLHHLGHGPMRRLFQAVAPTQGLLLCISILVLRSVLASCRAGTLLLDVASIALPLADTRAISATTMLAAPFYKLFIHLQLLLLILLITCDHMDVWDVAALLVLLLPPDLHIVGCPGR